ncbi:BTAD domain-containing putative transcriptional regulator [Streptomyces diastatochromogenes]|nr:BTAD domain-containing putative transcriptional regulator [Streptomyces diastatochromogenes]
MGRRPTSDPLNAVQVRVSRLRRLFRAAWGEDGDAVIVTKPGGYVLDLDRRSVDGAAFEDLVRDARRRRRYGDRAGALAGVERALDLWRGAPSRTRWTPRAWRPRRGASTTSGRPRANCTRSCCWNSGAPRRSWAA